MDGKKKRGKKKRANHQQDKHGEDTTSNSNAEEIASNTGEEAAALLVDQSQVHPNSNGQSMATMDAQNVGLSESDVEVHKHRIYEANFAQLQETTKHLVDEKNAWIQKVMYLEHEVVRLQGLVNSSVQNGTILEKRISMLRNDYDLMVTEEAVLADKIKIIEKTSDSWTLQEASYKERISGLEETNQSLLVQVRILEEASSNLFQENLKLTERLGEMESRMQTLEPEVREYSASKDTKSETRGDPSANAADPITQNAASLPYAEESGHPTSKTDPDGSLPSGQVLATTEGNHAGDHVDTNVLAPTEATPEEPPRSSEDTVQIPMDDIEIHEEKPKEAAEGISQEVPLIDAPLIGAPFRLISFMAKYVSGADLVDERGTSRRNRGRAV